MGTKHSSAKCTPTTIDYIRTKDVRKLTRQLSQRKISFRRKKKLNTPSENPTQLLQFDAQNDQLQRSALHFAAVEGKHFLLSKESFYQNLSFR